MSKCIRGEEGQENDDRLELYALGRLPFSEVEKLEEHLLVCDSCRDRLDDVAAFACAAREALKETRSKPSASFSPGFSWPGFSWSDFSWPGFSWSDFSWPGFSWLPNMGFWRPGLALAGVVAALMLAAGMYRVWQGGPLAPVAALHLTAIRGARSPVVRPARELDIDFADAGNAAQVTIVNAQRATVWTGVAIHGLADTSVTVRAALPEGEYFATVYTGGGTVIREYEFRIAR